MERMGDTAGGRGGMGERDRTGERGGRGGRGGRGEKARADAPADGCADGGDWSCSLSRRARFGASK